MPYLSRDGARLYYEAHGDGQPVVATHGLCENVAYWTATGISQRLVDAGYRFIGMDMRGHGISEVTAEPGGFDVDTVADDIGALADHLHLDRFHLLSHATGGIAAIRYATTRSERLYSLVATDTSAQSGVIGPADDAAERARRVEALAASFDRGDGWDTRLRAMRERPGPFLFTLNDSPNSETLWPVVDEMFRRGDPATIARFIRSFYVDPDPHVDALRRIGCPTLVLLGEHDVMFVETSALLAREIPGARHVVLHGVGHMTAIEAPSETADAIIDFLSSLRRT